MVAITINSPSARKGAGTGSMQTLKQLIENPGTLLVELPDERHKHVIPAQAGIQ